MQSAEVLSPEALGEAARDLSSQAEDLMAEVKRLALYMGESHTNGPRLGYVIRRSGIAVWLNQFNPDVLAKDNTRYLPELPETRGVHLGLPEEVREYTLRFDYQLREAAEVAQHDLGSEVLDQDQIILSNRCYKFSPDGLLTKALFVEGSGDFMNPVHIVRGDTGSFGVYRGKNLPVKTAETERLSTAMTAIRNRLVMGG